MLRSRDIGPVSVDSPLATVGGVPLLANRFVRLALTILARRFVSERPKSIGRDSSGSR